MEEFSALAARVAAGVGELRGVLILSRDGLVLGAFPEGSDALVKPAWLRFAGLGEPDKGFIEFGDELWAYIRRGPYASFAVTAAHVRPGLVMDQLEQMLMAAEELRAKREAVRVPDVVPAPTGKQRASVHPESRPATAPPTTEAASARSAPPTAGDSAPARPMPPLAPPGPVRPGAPQAPPAPARPGVAVGAAYGQPPGSRPPRVPDVSGPASVPSPAPGPDGGPERPPIVKPTAEQPAVGRPPEDAPEDAPDTGLQVGTEPRAPTPGDTASEHEEEGEVDPVLLAQEFSRLLQETEGPDET
jgi:hypothetical protein